MRQIASAIILCIIMLVVGSGFAAATPFFDFYGFNYLDGPSFSIGTLVTVCMVFDPVQPESPLPLDLEGNEYTVYVGDLQINEVQATGGIVFVEFSGGIIQIFEDPAKNAEWAIDPPNAQVPSNFTDGVLILGGDFSDSIMIFDLALGTGTVQGHVDFLYGSRLGELVVPNGWLFAGGVTTNPIVGIPQGYEMAWDPQLLAPYTVPVRASTWGRVRGLFR